MLEVQCADLLALCRVFIESVNRVADICLNAPEDEAQELPTQLKIMIRQLVGYGLGAAGGVVALPAWASEWRDPPPCHRADRE